MMANKGGPYITLSRLNLHKYATRNTMAKPLFEYMLHHENSVPHALELAALATEASGFQDWWWKVALGKCYFRCAATAAVPSCL